MVHTAFLYRLNVVPAYLVSFRIHVELAPPLWLFTRTLLPRWFYVALALVLRCSRVGFTLLPRGSTLLPLFPRCSRVAPVLLLRRSLGSVVKVRRSIDLLVFLRGFEDGSLATSVSTVFTGRSFGLTGFSLVSLSLFLSFCLAFLWFSLVVLS